MEENQKLEWTEEQQKAVEQFMCSSLIKRHKSFLQQIYNRCITKDMSIADLRQEVKDKKSPFTLSQRAFLINYKEEFIKQLLSNLYSSRQTILIKDFINNSSEDEVQIDESKAEQIDNEDNRI